MRNVVAALALLLVAASGGCHRDQCVPTCEKNAKALGCGSGDKCKKQCQDLHTSPICLAEMKLFEACFLKEPVKNWVCDQDGIPAVDTTFCQPERARVIDCLSRQTPKMPQTPPPKP